MKKRDLISLNSALVALEGRQFTVKFSYFMAKNKVMIKDEFAALDEVRKPSPEYIAFDTKRAEMAMEFADKDDDGKPKIENNNFIITQKVEEFRKALDELKATNAKVIETYEKQVKDFEELLDEDIDFRGPKIDLKDIPPTIEPSFLEVLITSNLLIEDSPELTVVK